MATKSPGPIQTRMSELAPGYTAVLCDVWGVIHNGEEAWPQAVDALVRYRQGGGHVVLVTNAPRRRRYVVDQILDLGVPEAAFDDVVTSGDVTRARLAARGPTRVYHVGTEAHLPLYEGSDVELVGDDACDVISCTSLFDDEIETPDDYADRLAAWRARGVPMLCANPDIRGRSRWPA